MCGKNMCLDSLSSLKTMKILPQLHPITFHSFKLSYALQNLHQVLSGNVENRFLIVIYIVVVSQVILFLRGERKAKAFSKFV